MLCTLFLTRYMMPILYSYFPAPRGRGDADSSEALVEGTNYSARFAHCCPEGYEREEFEQPAAALSPDDSEGVPPQDEEEK